MKQAARRRRQAKRREEGETCAASIKEKGKRKNRVRATHANRKEEKNKQEVQKHTN